jgi:asparagine synthase (glutamine-hydrolysing)
MLQALFPYADLAPRLIAGENHALGARGHSATNWSVELAPRRLEHLEIVADARIDNRDELARLLGIGGSQRAPVDDADLLLRGWSRFGLSLPQHLVGDFAFAVIDHRLRQLTLVRDLLGQRPLFFTKLRHGWAFASMPTGLFALPDHTPRINRERVAQLLAGSWSPASTTYFHQISRLPPGHVAVFKDGEVEQRSYWSPPVDELVLSDDEYVERYRFELDRAVRSSLQPRTGSVAAQLSSGWDSSAVAATAARIEGPGLLALTAAPRKGFAGPVLRGRVADESPLAALTAELHSMRHQIIRAHGGVLLRLRSQAELYQEPDRAVVNMEWWTGILAAARDDGAGVLLTGQMGNLTLNAGGLPALNQLLSQGALKRWCKEVRAIRSFGAVSWRGAFYASAAPWLPRWFDELLGKTFLGDATSSEASFLCPNFRMRSGQSPPPKRRRGRYGARQAQLAGVDYGNFRKGALAEYGVDERDPTADRRIIDFSLALPPSQFLADGISRPLARRALADLVPSALLSAPLRGHQGADWFERIDRGEALDLVDSLESSSGCVELLNLAKMRLAFCNWPSDGSAAVGTSTLYRQRLLTALSTGVFIQWVESLASAKRTEA